MDGIGREHRSGWDKSKLSPACKIRTGSPRGKTQQLAMFDPFTAAWLASFTVGAHTVTLRGPFRTLGKPRRTGRSAGKPPVPLPGLLRLCTHGLRLSPQPAGVVFQQHRVMSCPTGRQSGNSPTGARDRKPRPRRARRAPFDASGDESLQSGRRRPLVLRCRSG